MYFLMSFTALLATWGFLIWFIYRSVKSVKDFVEGADYNGVHLTRWDILSGLVAGEFTVVYQPQYSLVSGDITGIEALARWKRTDGTFVSPVDFIHLAEKVGVISNVGHYVMRSSFLDYKKFNFDGLILSVNVSLMELEGEGYIDCLDSLLLETDFNPHYLKLEVTENKAYTSRTKVEDVVKDIRSRGISIVVDDFGTGVSTHDKLSISGVSGMKIDKSFVMGLDTLPHNKILVEHMVSLGKKLNMSIVAEGVETYEHLSFMATLGVDAIQGYYIARPMAVGSLSDWLNETDRGRLLLNLDDVYNRKVIAKTF